MRVRFYSASDNFLVVFVFFFFQAEDGIRDKLVTGVQTCALPISGGPWRLRRKSGRLLQVQMICGGRECRGRGDRGRRGIFLACGFGCADGRTVSHTWRRRSCRFLSDAPSPLGPAACYRRGAPACASSHAPNARGASAPAPPPHTTPLRFRVGAAWRTRGENEVAK